MIFVQSSAVADGWPATEAKEGLHLRLKERSDHRDVFSRLCIGNGTRASSRRIWSRCRRNTSAFVDNVHVPCHSVRSKARTIAGARYGSRATMLKGNRTPQIGCLTVSAVRARRSKTRIRICAARHMAQPREHLHSIGYSAPPRPPPSKILTMPELRSGKRAYVECLDRWQIANEEQVLSRYAIFISNETGGLQYRSRPLLSTSWLHQRLCHICGSAAALFS